MSMFKLGIASPRWWRRMAAIVGMSLALVVASGVPAHAANGAFFDDFEAADAGYVWTSEHGACCYVAANPDSHSPAHSGFVPYNTTWTSLGRSVHLPAVLDSTTRRKATIWIRPEFIPTVNVEVINPTDWTYIALRTVSIVPNSGWQQITLPLWTPSTLDVVFRVSNVSLDVVGQVWIDDLRVLCAWL